MFADKKQIVYKSQHFNVMPNATESHEFSLNDFHIIEPGLNIHGLFLNTSALKEKFVMVPLETEDSQLDFNKLFIQEHKSYTF
jgi:hypothetical protein